MAKLDEIQAVYREALQIEKALLGEDHFMIATTMNNLAMLLFEQVSESQR